MADKPNIQLNNISIVEGGFVDTKLFSPAAVTFLETGRYTTAPEGTYAYKQFWDEETRRFVIGAEYMRSPLEYECLSSASMYLKWYVELWPSAVPVAEEDFPNLITSY